MDRFFFNSIISLIDGAKLMTLSILLVGGHLEGSVSQIF